MPAFRFVKSEMLLEGRAFKIRRDHLQTPDGRDTHYEILEHAGSVVMLPIDSDGNLVLVRQYRQAARLDLLELPAGTRDEGESFEACAARELREETGMSARVLEKVGEFYLAPGYSTEFMVVFIARDLSSDPLPSDSDEFLEIERMPLHAVIEMARRGNIPDAKSLAALFIAGQQLEQYV